MRGYLNWIYDLVLPALVLAATTPAVLALPYFRPTHMIPIRIDKINGVMPTPMVVRVIEDNSIWVNDRPVTLKQLERLSTLAKADQRPVLLKPEACALHFVVVLAATALARSGNSLVRLALPDSPSVSDNAGQRHKRGVVSSNQDCERPAIL